MKKEELAYLQNELIEEFRSFQKLVENNALDQFSAPGKEVLNPDGSFTVIRIGADLIEDTLEFASMGSHFEYYRRLCIPEERKVLRDFYQYRPPVYPRPLPPSEPYTQEYYDEDQEDSNVQWGFHAFGVWCDTSGFFTSKYKHLDRGDWTPIFGDMLEHLSELAGWIDCKLWLPPIVGHAKPKAVDCRDVLPKSAEMQQMHWLVESWLVREFIGLSIMTRSFRKTNPQHIDATQGLFFDTDFAQKQSYSIFHKRLKFEDVYPNRYNEEGMPFDPFKNERLILQLSCPWKAGFYFQSANSASLTEPAVAADKLRNSEDARYRWPGEYDRQSLAYIIEEVCSHPQPSGKPRERPPWGHWFGPLFDCLLSFAESGAFEKFGLLAPLRLFEMACLATDRMVELLLYVSSLESTLAAGTSQNIGEKLGTRYSRIVSENADNAVSESVALIYKRRSEIVHGKDPVLVTSPFSGIETHEKVRAICRRSILMLIFVLDGLRRERNCVERGGLYEFLTCNEKAKRVPGNRTELCSAMGEFENDEGFWTAFHTTVNRYSAHLGFPLTDFFPT